MKTAGVTGVVIHPPASLGDAANACALEAASRYPERFCILGHFDLARPDREAVVARWREQPGMLGLRFAFNQPGQQALWTDRSLDGFWSACEREGLPVGLMPSGPTMAAFRRIAERHPGLKLLIDHLGRGGHAAKKDDACFEDLDEMLALARLPNVAVKLSAAPSYSTHAYPWRNLHDYIHRIVDAFGPERSFWGSDLTRVACSYREAVTMYTEEMPWLKGRDLELVMGEGIAKWIGWEWGLAAAS
jgi:predicted TIM-barrel fold metal-dependent hydrolase